MKAREWAEALLGYVIVALAGIAAWEVLSRATPILPPPSDTIEFFLENVGRAASDARITLENTLLGFLVALSLAVGLSWLGLRGGLAGRIVEAINVYVQSVSALVWALAFLIVFGFTSRVPAVGVAAATAFPILLSSILKGFETVRAEYGELATILGMPPLRALTVIYLPGSIPFIVAASRSALGAALRISVVAEAFGSSGGIGYTLFYYYELHVYEGFLSWSLLLVALMLALDKLVLARLEVWARKWQS